MKIWDYVYWKFSYNGNAWKNSFSAVVYRIWFRFCSFSIGFVQWAFPMNCASLNVIRWIVWPVEHRQTDRQTNIFNHKRRVPTYLRFSQVIKEREMTHSGGCYNIAGPGLKVFTSFEPILFEQWPLKHRLKICHITFDLKKLQEIL